MGTEGDWILRGSVWVWKGKGGQEWKGGVYRVNKNEKDFLQNLREVLILHNYVSLFWKVMKKKKYFLHKYQNYHLTIPPIPPFFMLQLNLCIVYASLFDFCDWYIALSIFKMSYCYVFILFSLSLNRISIIFMPSQDFCFSLFNEK